MHDLFYYIGQGFLVLLIIAIIQKTIKKISNKKKLKKEKELQEQCFIDEITSWEIGDLLYISPEKFNSDFISQNSHPVSGVLFATLSKWDLNNCEAVFNNGLSVIFDIKEVNTNFSYKTRNQRDSMINFLEETKGKKFEDLMSEYQKIISKTEKFIPYGNTKLLQSPQHEKQSHQSEFEDLEGENLEITLRELEVLGIALIDLNVKELNIVMNLASEMEDYELANMIKTQISNLQKIN